ncbi:MAG: response regulator transcription factor [Bacteroidetes bacterium]|nr:response regulator transcription factor [Bacteroidota bacterium]
MKLLIADDHPIFRTGLKDILLSSFKKMDLIECVNGAQAIEKIKSLKPDIAILDINMPELNGLEVAKIVLKENLKTKVIILTMYRDREMIKKAMEVGAFGYILKDFAADEIIECIEKVKLNEKYIGPELQTFYQEIGHEDLKKKELNQLIKNLSQAELKTLKLVSQNKSTKEIAELLFLSEKTIENYRSKICQKLMLPPRNNSLLLWTSENKELLNSINEF